MTTKFTPGPWHVKPNSIGGPAVGPEEAVVADIRTYGGPHVGGQQHPQTAANARLIAAAPDLLRYLKEARRTLEMWKDVAPAVSLCADIDAAIARATGEQP